MKYRYTIIEKSTFCVDLDTTSKEEAYEIIRDMLLEGEIDSTDPDFYENDEYIEEEAQ